MRSVQPNLSITGRPCPSPSQQLPPPLPAPEGGRCMPSLRHPAKTVEHFLLYCLKYAWLRTVTEDASQPGISPQASCLVHFFRSHGPCLLKPSVFPTPCFAPSSFHLLLSLRETRSHFPSSLTPHSFMCDTMAYTSVLSYHPQALI